MPCKRVIDAIRTFICKQFHKHITRPANGSYACLDCGRMWPSPWR